MKKLTKEEITELVSNIMDEEFNKEAAHMPEKLEEMLEREQSYESLIMDLNAFVIGFNYNICKNVIIEVINNIMN